MKLDDRKSAVAATLRAFADAAELARTPGDLLAVVTMANEVLASARRQAAEQAPN